MTSFMTYLQLHLISANKYDISNDVIVQSSYATANLAQIQNRTKSCTVMYIGNAVLSNGLSNTIHSMNNTGVSQLVTKIVVVVVDCGLTSHSAIFQLYSDETDVQLLPGTHAMGS